MLSKQRTRQIDIAFQSGCDNSSVLGINVPVKRVFRQKQSTVAIVQIMQGVAVIKQQRHGAGFEQLEMKISVRQLPLLLLSRRHAIGTFDVTQLFFRRPDRIRPGLIAFGDRLSQCEAFEMHPQLCNLLKVFLRHRNDPISPLVLDQYQAFGAQSRKRLPKRASTDGETEFFT
ncbi:hypothetical protein U724_01335 [Pseudomonas chlororaphis subsp. aurantiaca PB-St2]|nr:hypothetical protein U724_01335 [Pseudomonas chlororaphis subsp. aurantiaca PB-St2]